MKWVLISMSCVAMLAAFASGNELPSWLRMIALAFSVLTMLLAISVHMAESRGAN